MIEVRNSQGEIIAIIHDPEAFAQLLDEFEKAFNEYGLMAHPVTRLIENVNYLVGPHMIDNAIYSTAVLEMIRQQLGDIRSDLYPTDFPEA